MNLLASLNKPYTETDKQEFINTYYKGTNFIKETEESLEAWEYTEEDNYNVYIPPAPEPTPEQERERLNLLSLTKREVFLALYKDKGLTPDMIRSQIKDEEALIEFDYANDYYRGNPLIEKIGLLLGYTSDDLDYLFENKELPTKDKSDDTEA